MGTGRPGQLMEGTAGARDAGDAAPPSRSRRKRWTPETAIAEFRRWILEDHGGVPPTWGQYKPTPPGCPSASTLHTLFGSWNAAIDAAGFRTRPRYLSNYDELGSAELQYRIDNGETLTEVAAELGITGQALGRRLARFRAKFEGHRVPGTGDRSRTSRNQGSVSG